MGGWQAKQLSKLNRKHQRQKEKKNTYKTLQNFKVPPFLRWCWKSAFPHRTGDNIQPANLTKTYTTNKSRRGRMTLICSLPCTHLHHPQFHSQKPKVTPDTFYLLVGGWTNPSEKHAKVKLDHFPTRYTGEHKKYLKSPPIGGDIWTCSLQGHGIFCSTELPLFGPKFPGKTEVPKLVVSLHHCLHPKMIQDVQLFEALSNVRLQFVFYTYLVVISSFLALQKNVLDAT